MPLIRYYPAAKLDFAQYLLDIESMLESHNMISTASWPRWIVEHQRADDNNLTNMKAAWRMNHQQVELADCVICFPPVTTDHHLRGALVEAGIALGLGRPVFLVGQHPDFGTWQYHPAVYQCPSLDHAISYIKDIVPPLLRP